VYRDFKSEYSRLYRESVGAFTELKRDVTSGAYPAKENEIPISESELGDFLKRL
jgi:ketopantoate hydroxymethyltransferase